MQTDNPTATRRDAAPSAIDIELLALDLNTCTRCRGTLEHIEEAIQILQPVLEGLETRVNVNRIVVESEEQARRHRFVSSPTVRVNGRDIVFETLESECDSCTDLCGCDEGTSCRVWRYRGQEYTEAPVGLVVESILRELFAGSFSAPTVMPAYSGVPENLRRFFRSRPGVESENEACCSPAEQETCCEPSDKSGCCDPSQPATCGCQ